jgi:hypothetical protein
MIINVELELEGYNEDHSIDEELKAQLSHQIAKKLADMVAETELKAVDYDTEVMEAKKLLNDTVEELRSKRHKDVAKVEEKISDVFSSFIAGTSYRLNPWGEAVEEITVGEHIRELVSKAIESKEKILSKLVEKEVKRVMELSEWDMERIIKNESDKVRDENAKKVAEFIVKGAL